MFVKTSIKYLSVIKPSYKILKFNELSFGSKTMEFIIKKVLLERGMRRVLPDNERFKRLFMKNL